MRLQILLLALATTSALRAGATLLRNRAPKLSHSTLAAAPLLQRPPRSAPITLSAADDLDLTGKVEVALTADSCPTDEASTLELLKFVLPVLATWLSSELLSVVDTAVVGMGSATELAALGPATMLTDSTAYLFFWLSVATTNLFASAQASGDTDGAYAVVSDALWCAIAFGVLLSAALATFGPGALAAILSRAPAAIPGATTYLNIRLLSAPAFLAACVLEAACVGAKDATTPLLSVAFGGVLNLGLDLLLVCRLGYGIGGAAIATLTAQVATLAVLAVSVRRKRAAALGSPSLLRGRPSATRLRAFLQFAGPIFLVLLGKIACYNTMTLVAGRCGLVALAAHQALFAVFNVGCKFGDAVSQTAQAYLPSCLGDAFGEGGDAKAAVVPRAARALAGRLFRVGIFFGGGIALAAAAVARYGSAIFTRDIAVAAQMGSVAPLLLLALSFHTCTLCTEGILLGARQLGFLAKSYIVNIVVFLSGLLVVDRLGLGLRAVWTALFAFQILRFGVFTGRAWALRLLGRD